MTKGNIRLTISEGRLILEELAKQGYKSQTKIAKEMWERKLYGSSYKNNKSFLNLIFKGDRSATPDLKEALIQLSNNSPLVKELFNEKATTRLEVSDYISVNLPPVSRKETPASLSTRAFLTYISDISNRYQNASQQERYGILQTIEKIVVALDFK